MENLMKYTSITRDELEEEDEKRMSDEEQNNLKYFVYHLYLCKYPNRIETLTEEFLNSLPLKKVVKYIKLLGSN